MLQVVDRGTARGAETLVATRPGRCRKDRYFGRSARQLVLPVSPMTMSLSSGSVRMTTRRPDSAAPRRAPDLGAAGGRLPATSATRALPTEDLADVSFDYATGMMSRADCGDLVTDAAACRDGPATKPDCAQIG